MGIISSTMPDYSFKDRIWHKRKKNRKHRRQIQSLSLNLLRHSLVATERFQREALDVRSREAFYVWLACDRFTFEAAEHCRTPKRGRHSGRGNFSCVLECGGALPLFDATDKPGTFVTFLLVQNG